MASRGWLSILSATLIGLSACSTPVTVVQEDGTPGPAAGPSASPAPIEAWTYAAPDGRLQRFTQFMLDPVTIHRGPGAQFGALNEEVVRRIGQLLVSETADALGRRYPVVAAPGPNVARIHYTLLGIGTTAPMTEEPPHDTALGTGVALLAEGLGRPRGSVTGTITYGVEIRDASSNTLLWAAVRTAAPGALDAASTRGTIESARQIARDIGAKLRSRLNQLASLRRPPPTTMPGVAPLPATPPVSPPPPGG